MKFNLILIILILLFVAIYVVIQVFDIQIIVGQNQNALPATENSDTQIQVNDASQSGQEIIMNQQNNQNQNPDIQEITELMAQILREGTGEQEVKPGDTVAVHYTGILIDGTKFDSSLDRGEPFVFQVGAGQVIPGWDQGLVGMKVGERRRLYVPADMAYSEQGVPGVIPANAPLIFEIELMQIQSPQDVSQTDQETIPVETSQEEIQNSEE